MIKMANGTSKPVSDLKKGDSIATLAGSAKVICVLKFATVNSVANLCSINGLSITHRHPIKQNGKWIYPSTISDAVPTACEFVYNLVLDQNHIAILNGIPVILLGHNYQTGILKNDYLGSQRIVEDLKRMPGWQEGLIQFEQGFGFAKNIKNQREKLVYNGQNKIIKN